jgi:hypothetical protein
MLLLPCRLKEAHDINTNDTKAITDIRTGNFNEGASPFTDKPLEENFLCMIELQILICFISLLLVGMQI